MSNSQTRVLDMLEADKINIDDAIRLLAALSSSKSKLHKIKNANDSFQPPSLPVYFNGLANNIN